MASGNSAMNLETGVGWTRGLKNALRAELAEWFGTRTWWTQILIWASIVNGMLLIITMTAKQQPGLAARAEGMMVFNLFLGMAAGVGVCIIMQSSVVGEKRSGTAAWVLSKPVSRAAFIVSKLLGNAAGVAVAMVLAQGIIGYAIFALVAGYAPPLLGFIAGLGVHFLYLMFFLTLTLMLGAIFDHPGPVIGIALAFLFLQQNLSGMIPALAHVIPWTLTGPPGDGGPSIAMALMTGSQPASYLPILTTLAAVVIFIIVALRVFEKQEL